MGQIFKRIHMLNVGAILAGYTALMFGIAYCFYGDSTTAIFHGLIFVGMTNLAQTKGDTLN